ncbi:hypothetical protein GM3708_2929 [Geminocystis sp. NIES-3708]|uniref:hypothetical protein n=1 Tax=Geminocystis sp. NIES-3708 TaxID=1615909 RepID=UPI0005FCCF5A|nr:hypothetical protein [Geminocystis sp. NIES-3708]BAQ62523.1 hypothetical protein GM3708_2929 [Geminocystis sp. NIES-3708]
MFTKSLSRIALVSGLILSAGAIIPQVALADTITVENNPYVSSSFTPVSNVSITHTSTNGTTTHAGLVNTTEIGTLKIAANGEFGFTVKVNGAATNTSSLVHDTLDTYKIPFKLGYQSGAVATLTDTATAMAGGSEDFSTDCSDAGGCDRSIKIEVANTDLISKPSGTYNATVTFTVTNDAS